MRPNLKNDCSQACHQDDKKHGAIAKARPRLEIDAPVPAVNQSVSNVNAFSPADIRIEIRYGAYNANTDMPFNMMDRRAGAFFDSVDDSGGAVIGNWHTAERKGTEVGRARFRAIMKRVKPG